MPERSAQINKSMRTSLGLLVSLFPKRVPLTENEEMEKLVEEAQVRVDKARSERNFRGSPSAIEKSSQGEDAEGLRKGGTSDGAKLGWEHRRGGGGVSEKPAPKMDLPWGKEQIGRANEITPSINSFQKSPTGQGLFDAVHGLFNHQSDIAALQSKMSRHLTAEDREKVSYLLDQAEQVTIDAATTGGMRGPDEPSSDADAKKFSDDSAQLLREASSFLNDAKAALSVALAGKEKELGMSSNWIFRSAEVRLDKEVVIQLLKDGGWDKLPMSDKAKGVIEDAISKGAKPVTEYTGKLLVEHGIAEEPPAFLRPKKLKVGDRVVPLQWTSMGVHGAQFDLQSVPAAMKVKKMYTGPAKVTKCAYPPGRGPSDIMKCESVIEDRMWGMDLEPEDVKKESDSGGHETSSVPVRTSDTTMVLRLEPLASPQGEVRS
jgi:hypothetical protein